MKALLYLIYIIITRLASFAFALVILTFSITFFWELIRPKRPIRQGG